MKSPVNSTDQLARRLGLSRWTVSRALNGHPEISEATAERIRAAALEYGFFPSVLGRGLRSGKTDIVGICLPDLEDYFLTSKISRLQREIERTGLHPVLQISDGSPESEAAALTRFAAMRCAGVLLIGSRMAPSGAVFSNLAGMDTPAVEIDPQHGNAKGCIRTDRAHAIREAVKHLHALGHRRLTVFDINSRTTSGKQRMKGLRDGAADCGWDFERDIIFLAAPESAGHFPAGAAMAEQYLSIGGSRPTAILALNDRIAFGAMRVLRAKKIRIPKDVSIIGYDNADFSSSTDPALTTFDPGVDELIDRTVAALRSVLDNTQPVEKRLTSGLVKPRLIVRGSTGSA